MPLNHMCCHWQATIMRSVENPYEGGLFYLYLQVPFSYPMCPPAVRFLTKKTSPERTLRYRDVDIDIDSIHHNWSLALIISKVLISIQSLLTDLYCHVCIEPELGEMYMNDREKFEEVARTWTWSTSMPASPHMGRMVGRVVLSKHSVEGTCARRTNFRRIWVCSYCERSIDTN
ncbi:PREDICTED: LOW QUALITY PROTEIN: ubiquitin-conjugating enzyme E2 8-like [Wasmannia auropunctata]|uniref:LOW QUALITY PROTEIN: ubiquitin-conjugating enzyme E2 8-like n=1 Tax=Wasmannia auropunctata TaxID=64793 RepID=UPI0005F055EE|nr:PREDICTED: LOW QUALITY PROTEIN: ubiquitin-conjugating enzyme E2 8-like [Wasmannia auropunctata]